MSESRTPEQIAAELEKLAVKARHVSDRMSKERRWTMCVPVNMQEDSDCVIYALAEAAEQASALLRSSPPPSWRELIKKISQLGHQLATGGHQEWPDIGGDIADEADAVLARLAAQPVETCGVVGYPEAGRMVCELLKGHEGDYHQQGRVRWIGYYTTLPAELDAALASPPPPKENP